MNKKNKYFDEEHLNNAKKVGWDIFKVLSESYKSDKFYNIPDRFSIIEYLCTGIVDDKDGGDIYNIFKDLYRYKACDYFLHTDIISFINKIALEVYDYEVIKDSIGDNFKIIKTLECILVIYENSTYKIGKYNEKDVLIHYSCDFESQELKDKIKEILKSKI